MPKRGWITSGRGTLVGRRGGLRARMRRSPINTQKTHRVGICTGILETTHSAMLTLPASIFVEVT